MLSRFSVKKPLTIFVIVVAILVLGVVAYTRMTPDLLPNMNFPYVMVVTAYPGASPEKVEAEITKPMEQAMSTLDHIQEVTSTSSENASMVMLEFAEDVNMDTIGVDIQQKITSLSSGWDDAVSAPYVLKINPSMLPVEVAALSMDGMDTIELTAFVNDTLMNKLEGIAGVARITASGMIEQELHVILDQDKIDAANRRVADAVNGQLDDAAQELEEKKEELEDAKGDIASAEGQLVQGANAMAQGSMKIQQQKAAAESEKLEAQAIKAECESVIAMDEMVTSLEAAEESAKKEQETLDKIEAELKALRNYENNSGGSETPDAGDEEPSPAPKSEGNENTGGENENSDENEPAVPGPPSDTPAEGDDLGADSNEGQNGQAEPPVADAPEITPAEEKQSENAIEQPVEPAQEQEEPSSEAAQKQEEQPAESAQEQEEPPVAPVAAYQGKKRTVTVDIGNGVRAVAYVDDNIQRLANANSTPENQEEYENRKAVLNQELEKNGFTKRVDDGSALEQELSEKQIEASRKQLEAEQQLSQVDTVLASMDPPMDREKLHALAATARNSLAEINSLIDQIDAGLITVAQAEAVLEQQKISGTLQMSMAAGKLAASAATIEAGLSQIESGLESIEDSREDALRQADLNNIITMDMVTQILNAQNFSMPAGYVSQDGINYMVSVGDEITDLETLENLLLFDMGMDGVEPVYLKDVAVVVLTDNRDETYARLNGQDGVMLSFEKQSTYATAEATDNIQAKFRQLEEEYPGLKFVSLMNQGDYIYLIVNSIMDSLLLGAIFAILILWLFLKDLRPTFITLCAIPISVIFAIVLMYFTGVTINMISLSGLAVAVGMLVDNSVVVIENIYRLRSKGASIIQAAVSGAAQVAGAVTASTLTTVCVFLPIVFVDGITRQLFTDLALTLSFALLASLAVSLTLVPAMASGMLRKETKQRSGFLEQRVLPLYETSVRWALGHRAVVLIAAVAALGITAGLSLAKGFIFMPTMDAPNVSVTVTMPEGANMQTAANLADQVLDQIQLVDGVGTVGAMMGSSGTSLLGTGGGGNNFDVTVYVTLSDDSASGVKAAKEIEERCAAMECQVSASVSMMDMSALTGSGVSVKVYAEDMDDLQNAARTVAEVLRGVEGIDQVSDGLEDADAAFHVALDRNAAMKHGLTTAQVYMELSEGLRKTGTVATLNLDDIPTEIIIEKPKGAVLDVDALRNYVFEVTNKDGEIEKVPLKAFAVVRDTTSLTSIKRVNQRRSLTVTATLQPDYNVTLVTREAQDAMNAADLGKNVSYDFSGENETIMEAVEQLVLMLLLGVLLVYLVMVAQFQSLKSPFIVMFTIPLAFTGGFLGLLLCGMEVSVISLIGFIMLTGIIVNNGIVLVDYINQLRLEGVERREAIVEAGMTRMRPILMTTITTVLGLLDMAVRQNAGTALMRPIAVVCIGGLIYATVMTLYVVPCIYDLLNRKELRKVEEKDLELVDL